MKTRQISFRVPVTQLREWSAALRDAALRNRLLQATIVTAAHTKKEACLKMGIDRPSEKREVRLMRDIRYLAVALADPEKVFIARRFSGSRAWTAFPVSAMRWREP